MFGSVFGAVGAAILWNGLILTLYALVVDIGFIFAALGKFGRAVGWAVAAAMALPAALLCWLQYAPVLVARLLESWGYDGHTVYGVVAVAMFLLLMAVGRLHIEHVEPLTKGGRLSPHAKKATLLTAGLVALGHFGFFLYFLW